MLESCCYSIAEYGRLKYKLSVDHFYAGGHISGRDLSQLFNTHTTHQDHASYIEDYANLTACVDYPAR
jgi:hypothetical protein